MKNHSNPFVKLTDNVKKYIDERGCLEVLYEDENLVIKKSFSNAGVFRGMHIQRPPALQSKYIRVVSGEILDIIFDPTSEPHVIYTKNISAIDGWIKIGSNFAHGFYAYQDTHFEYICQGAYSIENEITYSIEEVLKDKLNIKNILLSMKDRSGYKIIKQNVKIVSLT